jgi:hypothetical protein
MVRRVVIEVRRHITAGGYYQSTTLDVDTTDTENTSDSKLGILTPLRWSNANGDTIKRSCDKKAKNKQ